MTLLRSAQELTTDLIGRTKHETDGYIISVHESAEIRTALIKARKPIVFLDDTAVTRALHAARAVPRSADSGRAYIDLISTELPEAAHGPMAAVESRRRPDAPPVVENGIPPFLPSRRAAMPAKISAETEKDAPAFPREELLRLN